MAAKGKSREGSTPFLILSAPPVKGKLRLVKMVAEALGIRVMLADSGREAEALPAGLEAELKQVDWSVQDVMVGTVRTQEQLRYNLKKRGYYVPAQYMPEDRLDVRWIALHEQDIGGKPGIRWVGQVLSAEKRPRGQIPVTMRPGADPQAEYYFFTVQKWQQLPRPIEIRDTSRGKPRFTNEFLLRRCTKSWQLFEVTSPEEYRLLRVLDGAYAALSGAYRLDGEHRLLVADGYFTVVNAQGEVLEQIAVANISRSPSGAFCRLRDLLRKQHET